MYFALDDLARGLGIEPRLIASKATVLPLDDPLISLFYPLIIP